LGVRNNKQSAATRVPQVAQVLEHVAAGIDKAAQDFEAAMPPAQ